MLAGLGLTAFFSTERHPGQCMKCNGRMIRHSNSEATMAAEIAIGIWAKNSPVDPDMISMGRKAATVVEVAAITGAATSETPLITASSRGSPSCRWR